MKALIQKFTDFLANQNSISNSVRIESPSFISGSTISGNTRIAANCKIYKSFLQGNIEMGRFSSIWGPNTYIISHEHKVRIKQFVSIARNVSVQESNHKIHTPIHTSLPMMMSPLESMSDQTDAPKTFRKML